MQAAVDLYTHMGFERAPDLDSRPFPEIAIKGYRLDLESFAHESSGSSGGVRSTSSRWWES